MKTALFLNIYVFYCLFYLGIMLFAGAENSLFFKPLLMLPLFLAVFFEEDFSTKKMLLISLFFSWVGDVSLIFTPKHQLYFIAGLLAFLIAHSLYIWIFYEEKIRLPKMQLLPYQWIGLGVIFIFLILLLSILLPHIKDIQIPVIIYACVICSMLAMAWTAITVWKTPANYWILGGAFSFVVSDSILAINHFYSPLPYASLWVMITYLVAQYFIAGGVLKLGKA